MTNSKRRLFLLLGFIAVLFSSLIACSKDTSPDTVATYTNENWKYAISFPSLGWEVMEVSPAETRLMTSFKTRRGFIDIWVLRNPNLQLELAVKFHIELMKSKYTDFKLLDDTRMQGSWDWYISYDYFDEFNQEFHGETYFKQVINRFYKIDTVGEKIKYDSYYFKPIVSTFKLL